MILYTILKPDGSFNINNPLGTTEKEEVAIKWINDGWKVGIINKETNTFIKEYTTETKIVGISYKN